MRRRQPGLRFLGPLGRRPPSPRRWVAPGRRPRGWVAPGRRPRGWVALAVLAATGLGACSPPHVGLSNGSVSACYRAIPAAKAAVHDTSAILVGVHNVPADKAKARLPAIAKDIGDDDTTVCAVVLHGRFAAGQVTLAPPGATGDYAVVLISTRHLTLVGATVLDHVPHGLGRRLT